MVLVTHYPSRSIRTCSCHLHNPCLHTGAHAAGVWAKTLGACIHLVSDFFTNLERCRESLMICRQLFAPPHSGRVSMQRWHFDAQDSSRSRPSCLDFLPLFPWIYWHLLQQKSCLKHRKPSFCHVRGRAAQRARQYGPLSSSICSLNGKISRKVFKVETLDTKWLSEEEW